MKRYRVWLGYPFACCPNDELTLDFEDGASEEEIEEACKEALDTIISNRLDTGWEEVE